VVARRFHIVGMLLETVGDVAALRILHVFYR
jgi:hypothetical protein